MSENLVLLNDYGKYACITLNRPDKRNALSFEMISELRKILDQCRGKYSVVIITGAGKAFCSGVDLKDRRERIEKGGKSLEYPKYWIETNEFLRKHPAIFIASVNGYALGAGLTIIHNCDLAIASAEAEIFLPNIINSSYQGVAGPATQLRILRKHASWLILTGKRIDGKTAENWGLVNFAVPKDRLMDEAKAIAEHISQFNPVTLDWCKKALNEIPGHISDWTAALEYGTCINTVIKSQIGKDEIAPKGF